MRRALRSHCCRFSVAVATFWSAALWASQSRAEERSVTAAEAVVRTAPFKVAPELARVRAGERLAADDQPQGEWRRVRLADGRYGFIRDADTKAEPVLRPPAPVVETGGPLPTTDGSNPPEPSSATPPESDGASPPQQSVPTPKPTPAAPAVSRPVAAFPSRPPPEPPAGPHLLGVMFELLPVGTLSATLTTPSTGTQTMLSADSVFAVAVAPFIDGAASQYVAFGFSPQVIFRVKGDGSTSESAKQIDLRGRLTGRLPMSPNVRVFGRLSPAFSTVLLPTPPGASSSSISNPKGFLVDVSVGAEVAVLPNLFLIGQLGYQAGFQKIAGADWRTSYLHIGAGLAIGL